MRNATGPVSLAENPVKPRFRWWHAVAIFMVANLISILPARCYGRGPRIYS